MKKIKRLLVYRLGSMGDAVVSLPCLHLIEKTFPDAERMMLTNIPINRKAPSTQSVLNNSGLIHNFLYYPVGTRSLFTLAKLWFTICRLRLDLVVYLMPNRGVRVARRDSWFLKLCGAKTIIGVPQGDQSTNIYDPATGLYEAEASRLARCLSDIGDAKVDDPENWDLRLSETERQEAQGYLGGLQRKRFVCCAVGTKQGAKDWGGDNWSLLFGKLFPHFNDFALVLIGGKEDHSVTENASASWPGEKVNLCGLVSPRCAAAIVSKAELFIGLDSGPMHLAASVRTPVVSIFSGQSNPGVWFPFRNAGAVVFHKTNCSGCRLEECFSEKKKCILSITPEEVLAMTLRTWNVQVEKNRRELLIGIHQQTPSTS